ncbi:hypothetical protein Syun_017158 [Stephania yunnanensis]|uniref:Uncharacterized protein n=1 Tax=Stephania yunnanensis TaxID=152371 RepID=A0AAP0J6F0_9MAGN
MADHPKASNSSGGSIVLGKLDEMSNLVMLHTHKLEKILKILRAQAASSPSPSTTVVPLASEGNTPTVQATLAAFIVPTVPVIMKSVSVKTKIETTYPPYSDTNNATYAHKDEY